MWRKNCWTPKHDNFFRPFGNQLFDTGTRKMIHGVMSEVVWLQDETQELSDQ